ncbi:MAG: hypothetical protein FWD25_10340 [Clostridia bacterium]|nr:hypothetical protein [Clostridia bacterium]
MNEKIISALIMSLAILIFFGGWGIAVSRLGGKKAAGWGRKFIWKLEKCGTREEIKQYFQNLDARSSVKDMFKHLSQYMCMSGYAGCGKGSVDKQFEMLCETFLNGRWRQIANKYNYLEMDE